MTLPTPNVPSPLGLLQERYEDDRRRDLTRFQWKILVTCGCLDRVKGTRAQPVVDAVLTRWPSAEQMADADGSLEETLKPIGMQAVRARNMRAMSAVLRDGEWTTPKDVPGVGPYALACWRIFVERELPEQEPSDGWLAAYWRWAVNFHATRARTKQRKLSRSQIVDLTNGASLVDVVTSKRDGTLRSIAHAMPLVIDGDAVLTIGQAAHVSGLTVRRIRQELAAGRIRGRWVSLHWVTTWRALLEWAEGKDAGLPSIDIRAGRKKARDGKWAMPEAVARPDPEG